MGKSGKKALLQVSPMDSMLLAFGQILQPTTVEEIYSYAEGTSLTKTLTLAECARSFRRLEHQRFFWRTADSKYVVTPLGEQLAQRSIDPKTRDKLRLFTLNRRRYLK
jgi:hypothetical protein